MKHRREFQLPAKVASALALGALLLAWSLAACEAAGGPVGSQHAPAGDDDTWLPAGLEPPLRSSLDALASPLLLPSPRLTVEAEGQLREFQQRLDLARQHRQDKEFQHAEKNLVWLLESGAPNDLKRSALLELALLAYDSRQLVRAQQIYGQYVQRFSEHPSVPEILLRQGLLYREMGAPMMALSKFYGVISSALHLKPEWLEYYQRLVLQAQTEIAETYYLQGKFEEATDFLTRLLKLDHPELNKAEVLYKLVRSYSALDRHAETAAQAELFAGQHPESEHLSEVRFLLASSLMQLGRRRDSRQQVLLLLQSEYLGANHNPENWRYWQHRAGNKIANELYSEGDYVNALEIYMTLAAINSSPAWQLPVWYQAGLVFERLEQPQKASDMYARILERRSELGPGAIPQSLSVVLEMAQWRQDHLNWHDQAGTATRQLTAPSE